MRVCSIAGSCRHVLCNAETLPKYRLMSIVHNVHILHTMQYSLVVFQITL